jgi:hypothetical protein
MLYNNDMTKELLAAWVSYYINSFSPSLVSFQTILESWNYEQLLNFYNYQTGGEQYDEW